jgi:hypothetical protein
VRPDPSGLGGEQPVLYLEHGARWASVAVVPALAVVAIGAEALAGGPVHLLGWLLLAVAGAAGAAVIVRARRALVTVRVTPTEVRFGQERLAVSELAGVDDVGAQLGARVMGGGWAAPRRTDEVPLRLVDGTTVMGWARHPDQLRAVVRDLLPDRE